MLRKQRRILFFAVTLLALNAHTAVFAGTCVWERQATNDAGVVMNVGSIPEGFLEAFSITPPARITEVGLALSFYCSGECPAAGSPEARKSYHIVVYAADGPNGTAGTRLADIATVTTNIAGASSQPVFYKTDVAGRIPVITEGDKVYVGWFWDDEDALTNAFYTISESDPPFTDLGTHRSIDNTYWFQEDALSDPFQRRMNICTTIEPAIPDVAPPAPVIDGECSGLDPSKPTIVLTHGLQNSDVDPSTDLWTGFEPMQAGKLIRDQLGISVNICKWVWMGGFQPHLLQVPTRDAYIAANANTVTAGRALSEKLVQELGAGYNRPIHFIGHSLGVAVNAYAAVFFLNAAPLVQSVQFTSLDRPHHVTKIPGILDSEESFLGYDSDFLKKTLVQQARPVTSLKIDNYYANGAFYETGVGDIANGPVHNHPRLVDPGHLDDIIGFNENILNNDHSGVQEWYRWSIDSRMRSPWSPGSEPCINGELNPQFASNTGIDTSLSPCNRGWYWSLNAHPFVFPNPPTAYTSTLTSSPVEVSGFSEYGCETVLTATSPMISCSEASALQAKTSTIGTHSAGINLLFLPATRTIRFEYRFSGTSDGDYVALSLDGIPIWSVSGDTVTPDFQDSGPISTGSISGQHFLGITLYSTGAPSTTFEIRNIRTISEQSVFSSGFETGFAGWITP